MAVNGVVRRVEAGAVGRVLLVSELAWYGQDGHCRRGVVSLVGLSSGVSRHD